MIFKQVKKTIAGYRLIKKGDKILVGVSGGPDSVSLIYALNRLKEELGFNLHIAHLDHMLRRDSAKDKKFVEDLSLRLNIPFTADKIKVREFSKKGSLEENARNLRFNFLFSAAKRIKADKIALGHTLDDQAETVLMRILRGSGLFGLAGIAPKRKIKGYWIIRPLIETPRRDIEAFLKRNKINVCRDVSNSEDIYFRNKIRNRLMPLLSEEYNKNMKGVLANMAQALSGDYDYLDKAAERLFKGMEEKVEIDKFTKIHPALGRIILRKCIAKAQGDTRRITFQHIKEIEDLIFNRPINSIVDLPKGVSVKKRKSRLIFLNKA